MKWAYKKILILLIPLGSFLIFNIPVKISFYISVGYIYFDLEYVDRFHIWRYILVFDKVLILFF